MCQRDASVKAREGRRERGPRERERDQRRKGEILLVEARAKEAEAAHIGHRHQQPCVDVTLSLSLSTSLSISLSIAISPSISLSLSISSGRLLRSDPRSPSLFHTHTLSLSLSLSSWIKSCPRKCSNRRVAQSQSPYPNSVVIPTGRRRGERVNRGRERASEAEGKARENTEADKRVNTPVDQERMSPKRESILSSFFL